jgi:hypothetical protein
MDKPLIFSEFAGIDSANPERLSPKDLVEALNVDIDETGQLKRRRGFALARAGAAHSLWSSGQTCLFVAGSTLYRLKADYNAEALIGVTADAPVSYCEVAGRVYWSNGFEAGVVEADAARWWGIAIPPLPGAAAIVGSMTAGTYLFTLTFSRADGQESGAPVAGRIDLEDGAGIRFTMVTPADPLLVRKTLYLSQPNGDVLYRAMEIDAGDVTADYLGDVVNLVTPLDRLLLERAPAGQVVAHHNGRMYVASGPVLHYSQPYGYELFDLREYIAIDGTDITIVAPVTDGVFVGTRERVVFLQGQGPDTFVVQEKAAHAAIPGTLAYFDTDGASLELPGKRAAMFATAAGLAVVSDGGVFIDLTQRKYVMPAYQRGAGLYRSDGGQQRYVAILQS